jgi:hypothetical protein
MVVDGYTLSGIVKLGFKLRVRLLYLLLPAVPVLLPERKFDENFDGAKRLDPVRAPSRPAPPEFELVLTLIARQIQKIGAIFFSTR